VFDRSRRDVVLHLGDLLTGKFDQTAAEHFFDENFITAGLKTLIEKSFDRLTRKRDQSATFLLSQAMGGGKTHSMIALGLLAKFPILRTRLGKGFNLGEAPIRVIGFDGRESDYKYGLWGALADQVGKKELFSPLYSPLQPPGVTSWINLLRGEPTIILLDELPPYFNQALGKSIGASNLAEITTAALSNLLVAANKEELSNVVIVISDLSATAYSTGSSGINTALDNLDKETHRSALRIEPVATQGDEVYHILRTRLFEKLPDISIRDRVAVSFAEAVKKARQMDLTAATPESFAAELRDSYPFHFSLRDLYGRFKANPGFQQTRGLLRLMRTIVANLWETERAAHIALINPYDIDLNDSDIFSEFSSINQSLTEAVRLDIANGGASHAEELDKRLGGMHAQDAAKLIYVASLSNVPGAIVGLRDTEVIAWLCTPDRDIARVRTDVLEQLPNLAWYLHLSNDGRLYFKNVQNLAAKLHGMVSSFNKENKVKELRRYLENIFKPTVGDVYQDCRVLPSWEEVIPAPDRTTLVVVDPYSSARPDAPLHPDWLKFYDQLEFKNRILFLTGDRDTMEEVLKNAAFLKAINAIIGEQESEKLPARDPQCIEAQTSLSKILISLKSSVQQTFCQVVYPSTQGLRTEHIRFSFEGNNYNAEEQIRKALIATQKFSTDSVCDTWVEKVRSRLFDNQNPVIWADIKKRAAVKSAWQLHHPRLLDDVKAHAVAVGLWREEGGSVRVGPFPRDQTRVHVRVKSRDSETGKAVLEIQPIGGTKVVYEIGDGNPNFVSEAVDNYSAFETKEVSLSFLCIDDGPNPAPVGEVKIWQNEISLRSREFQQGQDRFLEFIAAPVVDIFYTTDGSDPRTRGVSYEGPIQIITGMRLVQAVAKKGKVESEIVKREIGVEVERGIDPDKPLIWKTHRLFQNRPTSEAYALVARMKEHKAKAENIEVYYIAEGEGEELHYTASDRSAKTGDEMDLILSRMREFLPSGNITLSIQRLLFDRGQDFLDWKNKDRLAIDLEKEVRQ
jgi:hypothetical protein